MSDSSINAEYVSRGKRNVPKATYKQRWRATGVSKAHPRITSRLHMLPTGRSLERGQTERSSHEENDPPSRFKQDIVEVKRNTSDPKNPTRTPATSVHALSRRTNNQILKTQQSPSRTDISNILSGINITKPAFQVYRDIDTEHERWQGEGIGKTGMTEETKKSSQRKRTTVNRDVANKTPTYSSIGSKGSSYPHQQTEYTPSDMSLSSPSSSRTVHSRNLSSHLESLPPPLPIVKPPLFQIALQKTSDKQPSKITDYRTPPSPWVYTSSPPRRRSRPVSRVWQNLTLMAGEDDSPFLDQVFRSLLPQPRRSWSDGVADDNPFIVTEEVREEFGPQNLFSDFMENQDVTLEDPLITGRGEFTDMGRATVEAQHPIKLHMKVQIEALPTTCDVDEITM
ncbi:uncharacterized protein SPPG_01334 [Spizellomyces punctatus DAOM BR117]|uniref:Uncharacterized protein n=1 Tax=Spizellomyces punctatus (strain DAOM BR117) TaxID=645134 RepID=A0A0L0HSJ3_SPIPD|nr:uncharacterized protein SPPG_01334 [Spizellomyces punctatus DAOM BR117]KND03880.1 hypothetical protein SPPG_01334 [Spizellomyces punctatus DAOM BR117]|eukprot:XP_016611919.1 hypothetical protein SPPG_01334 [Spizellomyces punctatus DAOM BR117]